MQDENNSKMDRTPDTRLNAAQGAGGPVNKKRKKNTSKIVSIIVIIALIFAVGYYVFRDINREKAVEYQAYTTNRGSISNSLSFDGSLEAEHNQIAVAGADTSVRAIYVSEGDEVHKDDRLLRLANGQTVKAEFDGAVNMISVKEDDNVKFGDALLQVVDFSHMKVSIRVDEYDIGEVRRGAPCRVTIVATEQTFDTVIDSINYVSYSSGTVAYYTAAAKVDVTEGCYPGMQVTVTVPREEASDVVVLKAEAISFDEMNRAFVYVKPQRGRELTRVYISTGVSNGKYVEITEGLRENETVYAEKKDKDYFAEFMSGGFGDINDPRGGENRQNFGPDGENYNGAPDRGADGRGGY